MTAARHGEPSTYLLTVRQSPSSMVPGQDMAAVQASSCFIELTHLYCDKAPLYSPFFDGLLDEGLEVLQKSATSKNGEGALQFEDLQVRPACSLSQSD